MSDIDLIKQMTTQHFVAPLNEFRANTRGLDDTHTAHLNQFQNIIGSLFAPGVDFSGKAADAIAEVVGQYLQAATSLSDAKEGLSAKLADASRVCETTAAEISHDLAMLQDTDPMQSAGGTFSAFVVLGQKLPLAWEIIIGTGLAAAATTYIIVNGEQQNVLDDMSRAEERWESDMLNVAMEVEPKLPPNPTDPKPFMPIASGLTTQQQKTAQELFQEFGGDISLDDIENLIRQHPQWSKDRLRQELLRNQLKQGTGYPGLLVGKRIYLGNNQYKTLTENDILAMIRAGYTPTHFAVIAGDLPLQNATTPEGRPLSWHALADSIYRHNMTLQEIDSTIDNPSRTTQQTNGAEVYIRKTKQGYDLVIVDPTTGVVTALKNLDPRELKQLGKNNGFNPNP